MRYLHHSVPVCEYAGCGKLLKSVPCASCEGSGRERFMLVFRHACSRCSGTGEQLMCPDVRVHFSARLAALRARAAEAVASRSPVSTSNRYTRALPSWLPSEQNPNIPGTRAWITRQANPVIPGTQAWITRQANPMIPGTQAWITRQMNPNMSGTPGYRHRHMMPPTRPFGR
jgi:hypothetical protein